MTLPCIKCGRQLESAFGDNPPEDAYNQPYAGTTFTSGGHYGSTLYDPSTNMGSLGHTHEFIEINVCDPCLKDAAAAGVVLRGVSTTSQTTTATPWVPETYEESVDD